MTTPARRYPLRPAIHALAAVTGRAPHPDGLATCCPQCPFCASLYLLADTAGVTARTVARWKAEGGIPEPAADRLACELGLHLDIIWPANHLEHVA